MPAMTRRWGPDARVLLTLAALLSAGVGPVARGQDMPDILPPLEPGERSVQSADTVASTESGAGAAEPSVGLRLEAQLMAAMALANAAAPGGAALGFAISYGVGWGTIPVMIGLDFMSVGRSSSTTSRLRIVDDVSVLPVTRSTSDRLLDFDVWLRVQPPRWPVRPYVEGFVGAKLVQTRYAIASRDEVTKSDSDEAWTHALGWGVGLDFMGLFNPVAAFSLTLGMRRLHGADVILERPILVEGRGRIKQQDLATSETYLMAGLCGRYDFFLEGD